jgi:hypothetical protein
VVSKPVLKVVAVRKRRASLRILERSQSYAATMLRLIRMRNTRRSSADRVEQGRVG